MKKAKPSSGRLAKRALHRRRAVGAKRRAQRPGVEVDANPACHAELLDLASIGYATLSQHGVIESISQVGARLLGKPPSQLLGKKFTVLAARISKAALERLIGQALAQTGRQTGEIEVNPLLGGALHLRLCAAGVRKRGPPAVLLAFSDITDGKAREEQLVRAAAAASEATRRKDEFLAVLSHALRGPLAAIRNCLFLLDRVAPTSDQAEKAKTIIDRGVTDLTRLVDDLLDLTRTTRGKLVLRRELVDLGEVVRRASAQQARSCEEKGIALATSLPGDRLWAYADSTRLSEAVGTLLGNVERFTPEGGRIVITLARTGGKAKLRVLAELRTGDGEPGHERGEQSGAAFVPASETIERASAGGLGLGLAMLKGELELHGGSVEMEIDEVGRGRALSVLLPLEDPPSSAGAARATRTRGRRVLIIEDTPDAAESLRDALQLVGHQVEVGYDGPSGIELARRFRPDVVICDIELPGMDGYAVARSFRSDERLRETYLIALTGYAGVADLDRAQSAGFDTHVAKPATMETLQSLLGNAPPSPPRRGQGTPR